MKSMLLFLKLSFTIQVQNWSDQEFLKISTDRPTGLPTDKPSYKSSLPELKNFMIVVSYLYKLALWAMFEIKPYIFRPNANRQTAKKIQTIKCKITNKMQIGQNSKPTDCICNKMQICHNASITKCKRHIMLL